eukprot:TRINITY_DN617_c0_g1_i8.p1 TRINITY_DN617_c0_g1~~TRINITY_DN617_c0_g1_i8.p1  ORF type:complete len:462 (-),score=22.74 TRINITY_DN617_c0_g1_i8:178-1563(-)
MSEPEIFSLTGRKAIYYFGHHHPMAHTRGRSIHSRCGECEKRVEKGVSCIQNCYALCMECVPMRMKFDHLPRERFVNQDTVEEYICGICLDVLCNPAEIKSCGHVFCRQCLDKLPQKKCPFDNRNFVADKVQSSSYLQYKILGLTVWCQHHDAGCDYANALARTLWHELSECAYRPMKCTDCNTRYVASEATNHHQNLCPSRSVSCEMCSKSMTARQLEQHVCPLEPISCPNTCGENIERQKLHDHIGLDCPLEKVVCGYVGCQKRVKRKRLATHRKKYKEEHLKLLDGYVKQVEEEKKALQTKVSQLEAEIKRLQDLRAQDDTTSSDEEKSIVDEDNYEVVDEDELIKITRHPHQLRVSQWRGGIICSCCDLPRHMMFICQRGCDFNICNDCVNETALDPSPSDTVVRIADHPHDLDFKSDLVDRVCDKCFSSMNIGHECLQCAYDICLPCLTKIYLDRM